MHILFGDDFAMGVIAVTVYEENLPKLRAKNKESARQEASYAGGVIENSTSADNLAESEASIGFGERANSHARRAQFNPKHTELVKYFYKYEWRETLCRKKIIDCGRIKNIFFVCHMIMKLVSHLARPATINKNKVNVETNHS